MAKRPNFQFSTIERLLSRFPGFSKPEKNSLHFLNSVQFLGALNDNIYKLVLIFYLIQIEGTASANTILSIAGAIFVIPFLIFSSFAGVLADRYSKSRLVLAIKVLEIIVMIFAVLAFAFKLTWSGYFLLFLLSTLAALFGPSKYGIIPELVPKDKVSRANGLITSFTYLAIIAGTFLASFLTQITNSNYIAVGSFCLFIAVVGFFCCFGIKYTAPKGSNKKIDPFFLRRIFHTLLECKERKHLLIAIFGSSFFLFIGGFTQLNIIPFAINSLHFSEIAGGYLFLTTALGIAFGAMVAGRVSKNQVELGLSCIAGLLISIFFYLLFKSYSNLPLALISLFGIGFCGGNFVVPFDTFTQVASPEENRGQIIAAANFLSFLGVLLASFALYFFNQILGLTAGESFAFMGGLTLIFSIFLIFRLSDLFLSLTSRKILSRLMPIQTVNFDLVQKASHPILMLEHGSFLKAWLLCGIIPSLNLLVPQYKTRKFPWFQRLFYSIHRIESPQKFEDLVGHGKGFADKDTVPCIYLLKEQPAPEKQFSGFAALFRREKYEVISVKFEKEPGSKITTIRFSK